MNYSVIVCFYVRDTMNVYQWSQLSGDTAVSMATITPMG